MLREILPRKRDKLILLPAIGSQLIVSTSLFLMPILINNLEVTAGLSRGAAGFLLSMELVVSALTTLIVSAYVRGHSTRRWALLGGCLAILGTALTLISPSFSLLLTSRLIAGVGAGVVGAEATSVLSRGVEREKLIALVTVASILNAAIWLALLPYMIDILGYRGPYICLLLINLTAVFLLRRLPSLAGRPDANSQASQPLFTLTALLVMAAVFLTQLGQGAFWSMEETFGSLAGFSSYAIGILLSGATLLLLLGALASAWASDRFGRYSLVLILVSVNAVSILLVSTIAVHWVFVAANALQSITNLSSVIYQLGLSASLDRSGRRSLHAPLW